MAERLFGVETEYAFTALGRGGAPLRRDETVRRFMDVARRRLTWLRDAHSGGLFLGNGARFYVDCGLHPELATPECANPWDIVRYILAGERVLAGLAAELVATDREVAEVTLLKCNVDYSGTQSTWGCHESYLHRTDPAALSEQIIPHLVSRLIYAGAGGFEVSPRGTRFTLSPRVPYLVSTVSGSSTHGRGIFHSKNESLCGGGYHRLHVLCGESLCSETATWLKTGVTMVIVAMIEAGLRPGDAVRLSDPLTAMRRFARDEACSAAVKGADGKKLTAMAIQRHYLNLAEDHVDAPFMPPWAGVLVPVWRSVLDRLAHGAPDSVATLLDWAIKLPLYRRRARRYGATWKKALPLDLRRILFEIDARFGQLGPRGIFAAMDDAGVLDHHMPGVDNIAHAIDNPPAVGRARLRGQCAKRFGGNRDGYVSDWQGIWDLQGRRFLDLSNPFETEERWRSRRSMDLPDDVAWVHELCDALESGVQIRGTPGRTIDGFCLGQHVILGRPTAGEGREDGDSVADWNPEMDRYTGQTTSIIRIIRNSDPGGPVVQVSADRGRWAWRTRDLRPVAESPTPRR